MILLQKFYKIAFANHAIEFFHYHYSSFFGKQQNYFSNLRQISINIFNDADMFRFISQEIHHKPLHQLQQASYETIDSLLALQILIAVFDFIQRISDAESLND